MEMTQKGVQGGNKQDSAQQQVVLFKSDEEEQNKTYDFLWVSEKYYLQGMCLFLQLVQF